MGSRLTRAIAGKRDGLTPALVVLIAVAALVLAGVATYLIFGRKQAAPGAGGTAGAPVVTKEAAAKDPSGALDSLAVGAPDIQTSPSPLKPLDVSSLNPAVPEPSSSGLVGPVAVNDDFSYSSKVDIAVPSVTLDVPTVSAPTTPTAPSGSTGGGTGQSTDCAQFASVPSCSYVGAPDSAGYALCKQCYPEK